MTAPSTRTVLQTLTKARLGQLSERALVRLPASATRDAQAETLAKSGTLRFRQLLDELGRDELRAACKAHGLDESGRARPELAARLLQAHGAGESAPPRPIFSAEHAPRYAPRAGDIVRVRHRQWLVEVVRNPVAEGESTSVALVCLDDDNPGRPLEVLWELELGARVLTPGAHGLGAIDRVDPPRWFAAYFHALKWSSVTATEADLFQAPFRAGILLKHYQLTPLRRALQLPRANLFVADDVGLGKTIETGLVLQELLLRQRVEFVLIACPASVCLQWREEMQKRFGLHFEVMSRAFIGRRRQERGFGVNPWGTHPRFIISHALLRRPEYRDPLLSRIGERATKSLLILDEAHVAAPASSGRYAVDSNITEVVRDVAPRFENRLFLSATPHNGHSNSFSALLELLDPQRFTRGVPVRAGDLEQVMVRRLKEDLRKQGEKVPLRRLVEIELAHAGAAWTARRVASSGPGAALEELGASEIGEGGAEELELAELLAKYDALVRPKRGQGKLVFINLQKRLLSSVEAFHRTLEAHHRAIAEGRARIALPAAIEDDAYGVDDDAAEQASALEIEVATSTLEPTPAAAKKLLDDMLAVSRRHRGAADAKVLALLDWIRQHQCPGAQIGGLLRGASKAARAWTRTRVIVFTEYGDTKRYLVQLLQAAIEGSDDADRRILTFHGGMGDEQRDEVQRAFNTDPEHEPVRILVATDAAREGINLQAHCADLFHFDVPWNPARLEQRNGRIDRMLQEADEVRCHYFVYAGRREDQVLRTLVGKVETIRRELHSMGSVLLEGIERVLEDGIREGAAERLDAASRPAEERVRVAEAEIERPTRKAEPIQKEIQEAGKILDRSRRTMGFDPRLLRDALNVGLELAGAAPLAPIPGDGGRFRVPELPDAWQDTLDVLRPPRKRDEPFWEFRKRAPLPVVFEPPKTLDSTVAQLHLAHPFVQRVLGRFLSQGFSAHDLSRVTVVRTRAARGGLVRAIALGRLSLFGRGATRLHDQIISVAGRWEDSASVDLVVLPDDVNQEAIRSLEQVLDESSEADPISPTALEQVRSAAPAWFAALWPGVRDEADALAHAAEQKLAARGADEATSLRAILAAQKTWIDDALALRRRERLTLFERKFDKREEEQFRRETEYIEGRRQKIDDEIAREPAAIEALYRVALRRLEPVGLVVLWPEGRA
ncbi:MAG TPA: DISARM system SNF2-like helicase DrmD [Byssovorax sp.]